MKLRFLGLLLALGGLSASVLIYASRSGDTRVSATLVDDGGSSEMTTAKAGLSSGCCASVAKPEVATLSSPGCPYEPAAAALTASVASVEAPVAGKNSECCDAVAPH